MKKTLIYALIIVLFSACATLRPDPLSIISVVDYSPLTDRGIFVTESNSVSFEYKAIGSVIVEESGGWIARDGKRSPSSKEDYYIGSSKKIYQSPKFESTFKKLSEKLESIGANGIINLKISSTSELNRAYNVYVEKITITGMAIKK